MTDSQQKVRNDPTPPQHHHTQNLRPCPSKKNLRPCFPAAHSNFSLLSVPTETSLWFGSALVCGDVQFVFGSVNSEQVRSSLEVPRVRLESCQRSCLMAIETQPGTTGFALPLTRSVCVCSRLVSSAESSQGAPIRQQQ